MNATYQSFCSWLTWKLNMLVNYDTLSGSSHIQPGRNGMARVVDLLKWVANVTFTNENFGVSFGLNVQSLVRNRHRCAFFELHKREAQFSPSTTTLDVNPHHTQHTVMGLMCNCENYKTWGNVFPTLNSTSSALVATPGQVVGCGSKSTHLVEKVILGREFSDWKFRRLEKKLAYLFNFVLVDVLLLVFIGQVSPHLKGGDVSCFVSQRF